MANLNQNAYCLPEVESAILSSVLLLGLGGGGLPGPNLRISGGNFVPVNRPVEGH